MATRQEGVPDADRFEQQRLLLSALMDGEADAEGTERACRHWRDDPAVRADWHAWHLIGDVLRSDDLAAPAPHDARFMASLRERLAAEPVVLAPTAAAPRRRSVWITTSAVAAGFAVVAGTVLVLRQPAAPGIDPAAPAPMAAASAEPRWARATPAADAEPVPAPATQVLIRDARLDRYLAAHQQFAGSSALGVPSGYLRAATSDPAGR
jgi:sigma-E factor negative regulatory protein RseA